MQVWKSLKKVALKGRNKEKEKLPKGCPSSCRPYFGRSDKFTNKLKDKFRPKNAESNSVKSLQISKIRETRATIATANYNSESQLLNSDANSSIFMFDRSKEKANHEYTTSGVSSGQSSPKFCLEDQKEKHTLCQQNTVEYKYKSKVTRKRSSLFSRRTCSADTSASNSDSDHSRSYSSSDNDYMSRRDSSSTTCSSSSSYSPKKFIARRNSSLPNLSSAESRPITPISFTNHPTLTKKLSKSSKNLSKVSKKSKISSFHDSCLNSNSYVSDSKTSSNKNHSLDIDSDYEKEKRPTVRRKVPKNISLDEIIKSSSDATYSDASLSDNEALGEEILKSANIEIIQRSVSEGSKTSYESEDSNYPIHLADFVNHSSSGDDIAIRPKKQRARSKPADIGLTQIEKPEYKAQTLKPKRNKYRSRSSDGDVGTGNFSRASSAGDSVVVKQSNAQMIAMMAIKSKSITETEQQAVRSGDIIANSQLAQQNGMCLRDIYSLRSVLSDTDNGTVFSARRRHDNKPVAIKRLMKHKIRRWHQMKNKKVPMEIALLKKVNEKKHICIVELFEWYECTDCFLVVMSRQTPVMDLFDLVSQQKRVEETLSRLIFWQVISAIDHCHRTQVLHRDVKLENVLINPCTLQVLLIDFGCGTFLGDNKGGLFTDFAGTPQYYPPEYFACKHYHGKSAAVYSLGVLLYAMLCGRLPFGSQKDIINGDLQWPKSVKGSISHQCKNLVESMMNKQPKTRIKIDLIKDHAWFQVKLKFGQDADDPAFLKSFISMLTKADIVVS